MPSVTDAERRAPRRDAVANREAILIAAARVLAESPDAPLDAVAAAAGLSRRALYGHFRDREALVRALIAHGADRLNAVARSAIGGDERVALALLGARIWEEVEQVRVVARLAVSDAYVQLAAEALAPLRSTIRGIVERGILSGSLRGDLPPGLLARLIEESAIAVLAESVRSGLDRAQGAGLVMLSVLSTVGLGWREAGALIESAPALRAVRSA
ncbi:TetR/AcrR family transcriptional regulator [Agromyces larvae]|uniref:TetR/AcrR family transcriptional regulator n=1 Tax=Agromyces larvae TaxID=2929802 RepID=A0ABY4BZG1_9MICO|nr:TetR/AcrR family transcriptional regulator [Agromyces larvae]UOE43108.1 TetR/AcrR family transcriptional regulator [Agromyces larvae]